MYELGDSCVAQRIAFAALTAVWLAVAWWLLLGGGLETAGHWLGAGWRSGDTVRRFCLAAGVSIYYLRLLFTIFVFLKRKLAWGEAIGIAFWILCVYLLLAIFGGTNRDAFGVSGAIGVGLFVAGSWMSSYAEDARHLWKQRPENHGRLYTDGLFRYSRHPNYLGDLLSFSGLCLISGVWITAIVPLIMLAGFVFVNIPMLDSHLHDHYGQQFDEYARQTRKLIPFVY